MTKSGLAMVAIAGLSLAAVSLTTAAVVGAREMQDSSLWDLIPFDGKARCPFRTLNGNDMRQISWDGDDEVEIKIPSDTQYRPGSGDMVEITGNAQSLAHVRIRNGTIELDCRYNRSGELQITLPGQQFESFTLGGTGRMSLKDLDQRRLTLTVAGAGTVEASGKVRSVDMNLIGASRGRLGDLEVEDITLSSVGSGDAEIAATDKATLNVVGASTVRLLKEPRSLESHIVGASQIIHADEDRI